MKNVALVDSEVLARVGIRALINWNQTDYCLVWDVENTKEAKEKFKTAPPDILFVEISASRTEGVELICFVRSNYPWVSIIALSNLAEFEYMRQAFSLGVIDYILKPEITAKKLYDTLNNCTQRVDATMNAVNTLESESTTLKKRVFGVGLDAQEAESVSRLFLRKYVFISLFYEKNDALNSEWNQCVRECTILFLVQQILRSYQVESQYFKVNDKHIFMLSFDDEFQHDLDKFCMEIITQLQLYADTDSKIGVSNVHDDEASVTGAYEESCYSLKYALLQGDCKVVLRNQLIKPEDNFLRKTFAEEVTELQNAYNQSNWYDISDIILRVQERIFTESTDLRPQARAFFGMVICQLEASAYRTKSMDTYFGEQSLYAQLDATHTRTQYLALGKTLRDLSFLRATQIGETNDITDTVQHYLQEHYNEDITLTEISTQLHISPTYLSSTFKKKFGQGLISYLLDLRIERAKQLLLQTDQKIYEIAMMVGYENVYYFNRVFKKKTGVTPSNYRSIYRQLV